MKGPKTPSEARMKVHQWLTQQYMEAAEHIPDKLNSRKRPRQGSFKRDPKNMDTALLKHLPPGSICDYYSQCCAANPGVSISKKLFSSEAQLQILLLCQHAVVLLQPYAPANSILLIHGGRSGPCGLEPNISVIHHFHMATSQPSQITGHLSETKMTCANLCNLTSIYLDNLVGTCPANLYSVTLGTLRTEKGFWSCCGLLRNLYYG